MWVFQQTNHCGPGCCVPACLSSLTGIHIDKIIYDPHSSGLGWFDHVNNILSTIDSEVIMLDSFCKELSKLDLLKSADINIDLSEDEKHELKGLYVVDEEKLKGLDKEELYKLHQHPYLQHIYMIGASIGNVNKLISLKKSR